MALEILSSSVAAAVAAATTQDAHAAALVAPWAGGNVTVRVMNADALLATLTQGPWVQDNSADPRDLTLGARLARTFVTGGTPTRVVFRSGSTDIFSLSAGVGSGDVSFAAAISSASLERIAGITITAATALPKVTYASAFTIALAASSGATGSAVSGTVTPTGGPLAAAGTATLACLTGTFADATLDFASGATAAQAFSFTPTSDATHSVSMTNTLGLTNTNSPRSYTSTTSGTATTATLSGSTSGITGSPTTWTVALDGPVPSGGGTVSITASGATLSTSTLTFIFGGATSHTFTIDRATDGTTAVSITNDMGLSNASTPRNYTSNAAPSIAPSAAYRNGQAYLFNAIVAATETSRVSGGTDLNLNTVGPMRDYVDGAGWAWDTAGGDWIDSTETRQGTTPWATMATSGGSATTYSASVTTALQLVRSAGRWNAWIVSRATGGTVRTVAARFNSTTAYRPRIEVTYTDTTTATLACRVSAFLGSGSAIPDQASETYGMSTATGAGEIALEFDLPTKDVSSATLYFTVTNHWGGSCTLNFNLADPPLNTDPVTYGYADAYPLDEGIDAHASTIFSHRYNNGTVLADYQYTATSVDWEQASAWDPALTGGSSDTGKLPHLGQGKWVGSFGAGTDVVDDTYTGEGFEALAPGMGALKVVMDKAAGIADGVEGGQSGTSAANCHLFLPSAKIGARNLFVRYYLRIGNTTDTNGGGAYRATLAQKYHVLKLGTPTWTDMAGKCSIGFAHKTKFGGNSGSAGGGYGWTMRQEFGDYVNSTDSPSAGGWNRAWSWTDYQTNNVVGHRYGISDNPSGVTLSRQFHGLAQRGGLGSSLYADRWYCIEEEIYLNSVDAASGAGDGKNWTADGYLRCWIDGRLVYDQGNVVMRALPLETWSSTYQPAIEDLGVLSMWFNWFHGGLTQNTIDRVAFVSGLVVGEERIGPMNLWPAWRRAMAPNTWAEIPTTNTLSDLDPVTLGLVPSGSNAFGNGTMTANGYAWTGGVWDDEGQTFWIPTVGGHNDWGGNEPHKIDLSVDTPTFVKLRLPSGAVGMPDVDRNAAAPYSNKECVFEDGRIRPGHSYNNHVYVPGVGPIITRISGAFYDGTNSTAGTMHPGVRVARLIDSAGESSVFCDFNSVTGQGTGDVDDGAAEFDPTRGTAGTIWTVGSATSRIVKIDVATQVATGYGSSDNWLPSGGNMKYVPGLDVLAFFDYGGALKILRIDTGATTPVTPSVSGSFSSGFGWAVFEGAGVDWSPELGCFLLWNNATSRTEISTLTPSNPADPSAAWVRGTLSVSGSNTVTPPVVGSAGATPFGRVRYSTKLRGLLLVGNMTQKPHFFATE